MGQGAAQIYNLITLIFLILTLLVFVLVAGRLAGPAAAVATPAVNIPTLVSLPTLTPTPTPTETPIPTFTFTPSPIPSDTPIPTATLTETPDLTATAGQFTATFTFTPSDTPVFTLTPSFTPSQTITSTPAVVPTDPASVVAADPPVPQEPTVVLNEFGQPIAPDIPTSEPTPSPYPFVAGSEVIYTSNYINSAGCNWQGIGGQVNDINNQPLVNIRVHVYGSGIDTYVASGSNTLVGQSGWEVTVGNAVAPGNYIVELQSASGTPISPPVEVRFNGICEGNLALVNFRQTRPF